MGLNREQPLILWLGDPLCHRRDLVGGKAANLSRLAETYQVPPGFCLTTAAFEASTSETLVSLGDIAIAYQTLAEVCGMPEPRVAVRSSAIDEDGNMASFAGQFETYLNISSPEAILEAVGRCWTSANSERVHKYRQKQGLPGQVHIAVLVQQLVLADVAVVAFSANPVSQDAGEIIINASWGLGETIVDGTVTPDVFIVSKEGLFITSRQVSEKESMSVYLDSTTRVVPVPRLLRNQPSLNKAQILEVAELALGLEKQMGWPVDIECAYEANRLFLLQCRPITTLGVMK